MAFFARGTDRLKKITKQSQFADKPNCFNRLGGISEAKKRSSSAAHTSPTIALLRCASQPELA